MKIDIYRMNSFFISVAIDEKTVFSHTGMGEHQIKCSFVVPENIDLQCEDYIIHRGDRFSINEPPEGKKANNVFYHDIVFEAPEYSMYDKKLKHEKEEEFAYTGTPREILNLIISNINEIKSETWTIGDVDEAECKTLSFNEHTCRTALTYTAQEFGMECSFDGMVVNLKKSVGRDTTLVFEIGRGKGLYEIERKKINDKPVFTRVTGYGGTKNIPSDYRGHKKRLMFDDNGHEYIDRNIDVYGIKEGSYKNDELYPHRIGTVSACSPEGTKNMAWWIEDSELNFDINAQLLEGITAKITFTSGDLSGNTIPFEVVKYDHATKRFTFNETDDNGYVLPNQYRKPAIGNTYVVTDIRMPQEYIDDWEAKLKAETIKFAEENCRWQHAYPVKPDPRYIKVNHAELRVFDRVKVIDKTYNINHMIRIVSLSYPLVDESKCTFTVAESIPYTSVERKMIHQAEVSRKVSVMSRQQAESARFWAAQFNKMKGLIFDPDGKIQQVFIEAMSACFGSESQNFALSGVNVNANYAGDMTKLYISAGELVHNTYKIAELSEPNYIWKIAKTVIFSDLDISQPYYLYAKCSKITLTGEWAISNVPVMSNAIEGYYCFNLGILFQVSEGETYRGFDFTKGNTLICGDQITTGLIQSLAKNFILNLTAGNMFMQQGDSVIDIGYTETGKIKLKGVTIVSGSGAEDVIGCDRGEYNNTFAYYQGDTITYQGSTYKYVHGTHTIGNLPTNTTYWRVVAQKGIDGENGGYTEYRYAKNGSTVTSPSLNDTESTPIGWSDVMPDVNSAEYLWMTSAKKIGTGALTGIWAKPIRANGIDGENGDQGIPGQKGADGIQYYTWIRYSDNANGVPNDNNSNRAYIGIAVNQTNPVESDDASKYQWSKVTGEQGIPGLKGADGIQLYTWVKYADNASGGGLSDNGTSKAYIGFAYNKETITESNNPFDYTWSLIKGDKGEDGKPGPGIVHMGDYSASKIYYGNEKAVVVVKYSGLYYISRVDVGSFTGIVPTNTSKWNPFGAQFESIATGLLLAENANIANFIFRSGLLTSQGATNGKYNIQLNGQDGTGHLAAGNFVWDSLGNIFMNGRISTPFEIITMPGGSSITRSVTSKNMILEYSDYQSQAKTIYINGNGFDGMTLEVYIRSLQSYAIGFFNVEFKKNTSDVGCSVSCYIGGATFVKLKWIERISRWIIISLYN